MHKVKRKKRSMCAVVKTNTGNSRALQTRIYYIIYYYITCNTNNQMKWFWNRVHNTCQHFNLFHFDLNLFFHKIIVIIWYFFLFDFDCQFAHAHNLMHTTALIALDMHKTHNPQTHTLFKFITWSICTYHIIS